MRKLLADVAAGLLLVYKPQGSWKVSEYRSCKCRAMMPPSPWPP